MKRAAIVEIEVVCKVSVCRVGAIKPIALGQVKKKKMFLVPISIKK